MVARGALDFIRADRAEDAERDAVFNRCAGEDAAEAAALRAWAEQTDAVGTR